MSDTPASINLRMSLRHIIAMERPLAEVGQIKGVPAKIAYRLGRVLSKIEPEVRQFADKRNQLQQLYGTVNPENNSITIAADKREQFENDIEQILEEQIDVFPNFFPIDLGAYQKVEAEIAPIHVMALMPMLAPQPEQGKDLNLPLRVVLGFEMQLGEILSVKGLPILTAHRFARFIQAIQPGMQTFLKDRKALLNEYADKTATNVPEGQFRIPDDKAPAFQAEMEKLLGAEIVIPNWVAIKESELGDGEGINSMQMAAIMPLLDMEEMMEAQPEPQKAAAD